MVDYKDNTFLIYNTAIFCFSVIDILKMICVVIVAADVDAAVSFKENHFVHEIRIDDSNLH